ncbi:HNH endonuclease [Psychrobacillus sp. PGGUH221]|uniref:HNH endonuclease n=1 Tax=Psychrobacillus sp. PGGUH221 TaxID=3020058 RepID=UPI0035C77A88
MIESLAAVEAVQETTGEVKDVKESVQEKQTDMKKSPITHLETRNQSLEGGIHPITGVPFEYKQIELPSGENIEGVFPEFETKFEAKLDESQYLESDARHFKEVNSQLKEAVESDQLMGDTFSEEQLQLIMADETPEGYVWHHSEVPGELHLVEKTIHDLTGHTGGRFLWGGGSDFR